MLYKPYGLDAVCENDVKSLSQPMKTEMQRRGHRCNVNRSMITQKSAEVCEPRDDPGW
jgi:hypothetical protein